MKICYKCKEEKPTLDFNKSKSSKDGYGTYCTVCRKEKKKAEYLRNREKYLANAKRYREENHVKVSEAKKLCYVNKIDQYKQARREYYKLNSESVLAQAAEYRKSNKEEIRKRDNIYKAKNRDILKEKQSKYQKQNSEYRNKYTRLYRKNRRKIDKMFSIRENMRTRFRFELAKRGELQHIKANEYLGCSWLELKNYLASQFKEGMCWNNYGDWQVDHITPLASAQTKEDLVKLCHYSNLQPLWAFDNRVKGAKLPDMVA